MFYAAPNIEKLLETIDEKKKKGESVPLTDVLDEDDIVSECRGDNRRLIDYFCVPENLRELVRMITGMYKASLDSSSTNHSAGAADEGEAETEDEHETKMRFKYPMVAAEILASETPRICEKLVRQSSLMDELFNVLELTPVGELDILRANHVCRVLASLVRMANIEFLQYALQRKSTVPGLLKHINVAPVADLCVRLLDGPESDRMFGAKVVPPKQEALQLLSEADVLNKLHDIFVQTLWDDTLAERLREETVTNVSFVVVGITVRILQMAKMFIHVPPKLNSYSNPRVIERLIHCSLDHYNRSNGTQIFGLTAALSIASELLTTEANKITVQSEGSGARAGLSNGGAAVRGGADARPSGEGESNGAVAKASENHNSGQSLPSRLRQRYRFGNSGRGVPGKKGGERNAASPAETSTSSSDRELVEKKLMPTHALEELLRGCFPALAAVMTEKRRTPLVNSSGEIPQPLGMARLRIVDFFEVCLQRGEAETVTLLDWLDVPQTLIDLFLELEWCTMLHNTVTRAIVGAFNGKDELVQAMWLHTNLLEAMLEQWAKEKKAETAGHHAHIILLATALEAFLEQHADRKLDYMSAHELQKFEVFCAEELAPARENESLTLGGEIPKTMSRSDTSDVIIEDGGDMLDVETMMEGLPLANNNSDEEEVEVVNCDLSPEELSKAGLTEGAAAGKSSRPSLSEALLMPAGDEIRRSVTPATDDTEPPRPRERKQPPPAAAPPPPPQPRAPPASLPTSAAESPAKSSTEPKPHARTNSRARSDSTTQDSDETPSHTSRSSKRRSSDTPTVTKLSPPTSTDIPPTSMSPPEPPSPPTPPSPPSLLTMEEEGDVEAINMTRTSSGSNPGTPATN